MSLTDGQKSLREHIVCNGAGDRSTLDSLINALSGKAAFSVTPATASIAHTSAGWSQNVKIKLVDSDGNKLNWYNGPITLAIADTSAAGAASISPAATTVNMVDGEYDVTVKGDAVAWLAAETATLTVETTTILGYAVTAKTSVVTMS